MQGKVVVIDRWSLIGDSHDGQIDVCRLVAMVIWSWTSNVVNRGQNVPVGSTPTDTIGPRSRSRLSPRYVLVVLKWRKNRSIFKARLVFSFGFVQSDSFLCQPTDEHTRETFACESDHSRLATIIVDVPASVENLPVVWIAYNRLFTRRADPRLPAGCYGNPIVNVKRGQSRPKRVCELDPDWHEWATFTFTIIAEVRSCCTEMMKGASGLFFRFRTKWLISMLANRAQSWDVCVWIRPLTIGCDYRGPARGRRKSARRVNGL